MKTNNPYLQEMHPWQELKNYGHRIKIRRENLNIFYFDSGEVEKPALVMLHGLGDEADTWRHIFLPLSTNFHVIAIDLPGFGRSDKPKRKYTPKFLMDTITHFLELKNINQTILMGNSLGGIISHALALEYPEKIIGLVLGGGALLQLSSIRDINFALMRLPMIGEWLYTRLRKNPDAAFNSLRPVYHNLDNLPKTDRDFLFHRVNQRVWSNGQRMAYFSTLRNIFPWVKEFQSFLPTKLSSLQTPTLIVRGEFDTLFPEIIGKRIVEVQPKASLVTMKNAKHLPHQEDPKEFLSIVQPWLKEIDLANL